MRWLKTLWECFFCWKVKKQKNLENADVVVGISFGKRKRDKPGLSNEAMSDIVWSISQEYSVGIIAQEEVVHASPALLESPHVVEIWRHRIEGRYLDTKEVIEQAYLEMKKRKLETPVVVTHPWHAWRVMKGFGKLGVKIILPPGLENIPFDPNSIQWWTRNAFFWIVREIPIRLFCLLKGWI